MNPLVKCISAIIRPDIDYHPLRSSVFLNSNWIPDTDPGRARTVVQYLRSIANILVLYPIFILKIAISA